MRAILFLMRAAGCQAGAEHQRSRLELVEAPPTTAVAVAAQVEPATRDHIVVYVGATWCEPCRYFLDATVAGQLDDELSDLRLVAFDMDRDSAALRAAGYTSAMIPLFAIPRRDGRASGEQIAGSIKGPAPPSRSRLVCALVDGASKQE
jgi:thiol-disulfide isomerase/thioredoxin